MSDTPDTPPVRMATADTWENGIVAILSMSGRAVGTGFVVSADGLIVTCTHVLVENVSADLGPNRQVNVRFKVNRQTTQATITNYWGGKNNEDVAILRLADQLPDEVVVLPLTYSDGSKDFDLETLGYPNNDIDAVSGRGHALGMTDENGYSRLQFSQDVGISHGFSGAPLWATTWQCVIGMVRRGTKTGNGSIKVGIAVRSETIQAICTEISLVRATLPHCPFLGLSTFREEHQDIFFGRKEESQVLLRRVQNQRLLIVAGPSGSGKSSLVFAGLLSRLPHTVWRVLSFRPGNFPFHSLATSLFTLLDPVTDSSMTVEQFAQDLQTGNQSLVDVLKTISESRNLKGHLLLIVDQFEELFTPPSDQEAETSQNIARQFIEMLFKASQEAHPLLPTVLLTLRTDFSDQAITTYPPFTDVLQHQTLFVKPMDREQLKAVIEEPARLRQVTFDKGLVERILDDIGVKPGGLPLLEFALEQLWKESKRSPLAHKTYEKIGKAEGALVNHAHLLYEQLDQNKQTVMRRVLVQMVHPETNTRRQTNRQEVGDDGWSIIQYLSSQDARLVITDPQQKGEDTAELVHEALIQHWESLRAWLDEERDFRRWQERLRVLYGQWQTNQKEDSLLQGHLLNEAARWLNERGDQLPVEERSFIQVSLDYQKRVQEIEEDRRQRELEQARQLAESRQRELEAQQHRTTIVRRALVGLAVLLAIALATTGLAVNAIQRANSRAIDAANAQGTAQAEATRADQNLVAAVAAQQTTVAEGYARATQEAIALESATIASDQARSAQSQVLAVSSETVAQQYPMRALLLAIAAGQTAETALAMDALNRQLPMMAKPLLTLSHELAVIGARWNGTESRLLTWSGDDTARVWDATTGEQMLTLSHEDVVYGAMWNGTESHILTWSGDGAARLWDVTSGEQMLTLSHESRIVGAMWNGTESHILSWSDDETARLWDATTGEQLLTLSHESGVTGTQWNGDESHILSWSADSTARVWDATTGELLLTLSHEDIVYGAMWNGDESHILTWSADDTVWVWDVTSGEQLLSLSHKDSVNGAMWNGDESHILTWSADGTVWVWDVTSGEQLLTLSHENSVNGAMWNGDESRILTWSSDGAARLWDTTSGEQLLTLSHEVSAFGGVRGTQWNGAESRILSWTYDGTARLWDATTGEQLLTLSHESGVTGAMWNGDESRILSWGGDSTARVWDAITGEALLSLSHEYSVHGAQWNGDENHILSWSGDARDATARLWGTITGEQLLTLSHESLVNGAQWNGDESRILSWSGDGTARVWDATTGEPLLSLSHEGWLNGAQWNGDESQILTWSQDGTARLWDATNGEQLLTLTHESWVKGAQWNGDESQILTWSQDGTVRVWDAASGEQLLTLTHESWVNGAQWNGDESQILTWSQDGTVRVWDATNGEPLLTLSHESPVYGAVWNRAESHILSWSQDGSARIWDATSGEPLLTLSHESPVYGAVWNRAESHILSWSEDGTARVWDATTGEQLLTLSHEIWVNGAQWNGSESNILTWSYDGTARLWDATTGELLLTLRGDGGVVTVARWNQAESRILLATRGGFIRIYYTHVGELAEQACQYATRNFTWQEWQLYFPGQPYQQTCAHLPVHPSVPQTAIP